MGMNIPKQDRETRQVELVETYNLVRSLTRLGGNGNSIRTKRALYHALLMSEILFSDDIRVIREAFKLP